MRQLKITKSITDVYKRQAIRSSSRTTWPRSSGVPPRRPSRWRSCSSPVSYTHLHPVLRELRGGQRLGLGERLLLCYGVVVLLDEMLLEVISCEHLEELVEILVDILHRELAFVDGKEPALEEFLEHLQRGLLHEVVTQARLPTRPGWISSSTRRSGRSSAAKAITSSRSSLSLIHI